MLHRTKQPGIRPRRRSAAQTVSVSPAGSAGKNRGAGHSRYPRAGDSLSPKRPGDHGQPPPAAAAPAALTLPTPRTARDLAALPDRCGHPPRGAARRRQPVTSLPPSLGWAQLSPAQPRGRPRKHPGAAAGCSEAPAAKRARHRALRGLSPVPPLPRCAARHAGRERGRRALTMTAAALPATE